MKQNRTYRFDQPDLIPPSLRTEKSNQDSQKPADTGYLHRFGFNTKYSPTGFTLIELLVVISIIAMLLAILLPSLGLAKRCARSVVCGANLKRIGMGLSLYAQDSRDYYPRALPLVSAANHSNSAEWKIPWPSDLCPMFWQAGYPSLLAPYFSDAQISNPFDYPSLPDEMGDSYIKLFLCPDNKIPREDLKARKCNFPLDYGLHNRASQNKQTDPMLRKAFLVADQTWALAFVKGKDGPSQELELQGWWNPFVHMNDTNNVLSPTLSVERMSKEKFIKQFNTANPPYNDPL